MNSPLKWTESRINLKRERLNVTMAGILTARMEDANLAQEDIAPQFVGQCGVRFRNQQLLVDE